MAVLKSLKQFDSYEHLSHYLKELDKINVDYSYDVVKEFCDGAVLILLYIRG